MLIMKQKFIKNDVLSIIGGNLSIDKISHDALSISGISRRVVLNNNEISYSLLSQLSGGIQVLMTILLVVVGFINVYLFYLSSSFKNIDKTNGENDKLDQ